MFLLYGWLYSELAKMPGEQWSIEILPPRGDMCLIDHGQASVEGCTPRKKKKIGGKRARKNKIDQFDRPRGFPREKSRRRFVALPHCTAIMAGYYARAGGLYAGLFTMSTKMWKRSELR